MKITLLNSTDGGGGAGIACKRLAEALFFQNIEVIMLSQKRKSNPQPFSKYYIKSTLDKALYYGRHIIDKSYLKKYLGYAPNNFSVAFSTALVHQNNAIKSADLLHLHWINDSFISIAEIKKLSLLNKKIVWTFHDMWPFTGGCHYSGSCLNYEKVCGNCPVLHSNDKMDLSFKQLADKINSFKNIDIKIITPSRWLAEKARSSMLFKDKAIHAISNGLNTDVYKPLDKIFLRSKFNINSNKRIILFGAVNALKDERKGLKYLLEALNIIKVQDPENTLNIELAVFGSEEDNSISLPFKTHFLGNLSGDKAVIDAYNIADIFAIPSLEDNLPNTIMEAMSCGVPVVGFNVGGIPEMIDHLQNGYIAQPFSANNLAEGILWILEDSARYQKLSEAARKKVVNDYCYEVVAKQHLELYSSF
jgi:glycosyltransferase involved in cell wall biosynthesis